MRKRIKPDGYFTILILLSILFHFAFPVARVIPYPYNLSGVLLIIAGFLLTLSTNAFLLKNRTSVQPFETPRVFLSSRQFRYTRNPIYIGMTLIITGVTIILGSLTPLVFPVVFVILIDRLVIPVEEKNLEDEFGDEYRHYMSKVRRWL